LAAMRFDRKGARTETGKGSLIGGERCDISPGDHGIKLSFVRNKVGLGEGSHARKEKKRHRAEALISTGKKIQAKKEIWR